MADMPARIGPSDPSSGMLKFLHWALVRKSFTPNAPWRTMHTRALAVGYIEHIGPDRYCLTEAGVWALLDSISVGGDE